MTFKPQTQGPIAAPEGESGGKGHGLHPWGGSTHVEPPAQANELEGQTVIWIERHRLASNWTELWTPGLRAV